MKKFIMATILSLSITPLMAETHAFPVPFTPSKGHTGITFTDLPGDGEIKIVDISGQEVTKLTIGPGVNLIGWNVTRSNGEKLASGVYIAHITNEKKPLKLVVIR